MNNRNSFSQIFWGLTITLVGLLFLAQNFGWIQNFQFWRYLPALLIILGLYQLFINKWHAWAGPLILILVGSYLLLASLGYITWGAFGALIWPTMLVLVGLSIIFRQGEMGHDTGTTSDPRFNTLVAFSGLKKSFNGPDFQNGECTTMFGGLELDLRDATIVTPPARLQTTTLFGGTEIFVPPAWNVRNDVVALFGGTDDKRHDAPSSKNTPDLIITGTVLFGGLEIKS